MIDRLLSRVSRLRNGKTVPAIVAFALLLVALAVVGCPGQVPVAPTAEAPSPAVNALPTQSTPTASTTTQPPPPSRTPLPPAPPPPISTPVADKLSPVPPATSTPAASGTIVPSPAITKPTPVIPPTPDGSGEDVFPRRFNDFECLPNPDGFSRPIETAKEALGKKFGNNRFKYVGGLSGTTLSAGSYFPFDNITIPFSGVGLNIGGSEFRQPSRLAILLTKDRIYFLGPNDFNDFLHKYGRKAEFGDPLGVPHYILTFLYLFEGTNPQVIDSSTIRDIIRRYPELGIDVDKVTRVEIIRKGSSRYTASIGSTPEDLQPELLVDFHTLTTQIAGRRMMPQLEYEYIITHYLGAVREKGEVELYVIDRNRYFVRYRSLPGEPAPK